jgi:hypothetical protein
MATEPDKERIEMKPAIRITSPVEPVAVTPPAPANDASVSIAPVSALAAGGAVQLQPQVQTQAQIPAQNQGPSKLHETLHCAMQLVARLCDRGISERERTNCALRARGNLRMLEQMLDELPGARAVSSGRRNRMQEAG